MAEDDWADIGEYEDRKRKEVYYLAGLRPQKPRRTRPAYYTAATVVAIVAMLVAMLAIYYAL